MSPSSPISTHRPTSDRERMGAVYTPRPLAQWVANLAHAHCDIKDPVIFDPACGDGSLLKACKEVFGASGCKAIGSDISPGAIQEALNDPCLQDSILRVSNSLLDPHGDAAITDICIMNPPWGAQLPDMPALTRHGYSLIGGRHDSWETFIEWSFSKLRPGTLVVAILPGSFFQASNSAARKLIHSKGTLVALADLGEGIFEKVFRSVAVVAYRTAKTPNAIEPTYYRFNQNLKKQALRGDLPLDKAIAQNTSRDLPEAFRTVRKNDRAWPDYCISTRGVELGARGVVDLCISCGLCRPAARSARPCTRCRSMNFEKVTAISPSPVAGYTPISTGKDVRWFDVTPNSWIRTDLEGIRYKPKSQYTGPKLLIRKTGLGLNLGIDTTSSMTNQVVFSYKMRPDYPEWWLFYFLGILGSDAMLAFHLSETGDTSWRSHPYVTPSKLREYPVPVPSTDTQVSIAKELAEVAELLNSSGDPRSENDLRFELNSVVNRIFDFSDAEKMWIAETLSDTERIESFALARSASYATAVKNERL